MTIPLFDELVPTGPDPIATRGRYIRLDATRFGRNLQSGDTTAQAAFERLDALVLGAGGLDQAAVDARIQVGVANWAEAGNADPIPASKLTNVQTGTGGLTQAAVDNRIAALVENWAEIANASAEIPAAKIPASIARVSQLPTIRTDADIDARISQWARNGDATAIPASKLTNAPGGLDPIAHTTTFDDPSGKTAERIYGEGTQSNSRLGYLRVGSNIEIAIHPGLFQDGGVGWIGMETAFGHVTQQEVGRLFPSAPPGLLSIKRDGTTLTVTVDRTSTRWQVAGSTPERLVMHLLDVETGGAATILEMTAYVDSGDERAFSHSVNAASLRQGRDYSIAFRLGSLSTFVPLSTGSTIVELIDRYGLLEFESELRAYYDPVIAAIRQRYDFKGVYNPNTDYRADEIAIDADGLYWARNTAGSGVAPSFESGNPWTYVAGDRSVVWRGTVVDGQYYGRGHVVQASTSGPAYLRQTTGAHVDFNTDWLLLGASPTPGTGGLSQTEVDARVRALVSDWAETAIPADIPDAKIPVTIARVSQLPTPRTDSEIDARVNAGLTGGVYAWARTTNTDIIPESKFPADLRVWRGHYNSGSTYALGNHVEHPRIAGELDIWVAAMLPNANANPPSLDPDSGWLLLTEHGHYRGGAPSAATTYEPGDQVVIPSGGRYDLYQYLGTVAISLERAQIPPSDAWSIINQRAEPWAVPGDATLVPEAKIPAAIARVSQLPVARTDSEIDARITSLVSDWAETSNVSLIPESKIPDIPEGKIPATIARVSQLPTARTDSEIDGRVRAGVEDWAETNNNDPIPVAKLANAPSGGLDQSQVDARVQAGVADWAEATNTDAIPADKLTNAPGAAGSGAGAWAEDTYYFESAEFTTAMPATWTAGVATPANMAADSDSFEYPRNPPAGVLGLVFTLWQGAARISTMFRDWGSGYNTNRLYAESGGGYFQVDPNEGFEGPAYSVALSVQSNGFSTAHTVRIHPLVATQAAAGMGGTGGLTEAQVDARVQIGVADWAEAADATTIPDAKFPPAIARTTQLLAPRTDSEIDARVQLGVHDWAETANQQTIPDTKLPTIPEAKIPAAIARVSQLPAARTDSEIDARITSLVENWAEVGDAALVPEGKLPATIARVSQLPTPRTNAEIDARVNADVSDWALANNQGDIPESKIAGALARLMQVEDWAEVGNAGLIPDAKIPATIARVSQLPTARTDSEIDGRVRAGVEDWAETNNNDPIPASKLTNVMSASGGLTESQVDLRIDTLVASWAEVANASSTIPLAKFPADIARTSQLPTPRTDAEIDGRVRGIVENFAEVGNAALVPENKIAASIARVSQLPTARTDSQIDTLIDARTHDWALEANSDPIPASKLTNAPAGGLDQAAVDARVAAGVHEFARAGSGTDIPESQIPASIARVSQLPTPRTDTEIDARITTLVDEWARPGGGLIPDAKLPATIARTSAVRTDAQIDARVRGIVENWAEVGDATAIPASKLTNAPSGLDQAAVDARITALVENWAEVGDATLVPEAKIPAAIARLAAVPSQSIFFVPNTQIPTVVPHNITLNPDGGRQEQIGDAYIFQYTSSQQSADEIRVSINGSGSLPVKIRRESGGQRNMTLNDMTQFSYYVFMRATLFWHYIGGTQLEEIAAELWAQVGNADPIPASKLTNAPAGDAITHTADFTSATGKTFNDIYGDGATETKRLGFLRDERVHEIAIHVGHFDDGSIGWAAEEDVFGHVDQREVGSIHPIRPLGLDKIWLEGSTLRVTLDLAETTWWVGGATTTTLEVGIIELRENNATIFPMIDYADANGKRTFTFIHAGVYELMPGLDYTVSFKLAGAANSLTLHTGDLILKLIDDYSEQAITEGLKAHYDPQISALRGDVERSVRGELWATLEVPDGQTRNSNSGFTPAANAGVLTIETDAPIESDNTAGYILWPAVPPREDIIGIVIESEAEDGTVYNRVVIPYGGPATASGTYSLASHVTAAIYASWTLQVGSRTWPRSGGGILRRLHYGIRPSVGGSTGVRRLKIYPALK